MRLGRVLLLAVLTFGASRVGAVEPLRVCLDPANPPLSMAEGERRGIYYEIAELLSDRLGRPLDVVWWPTNIGKRAIRLKLLAGECEVMLGVPFVKGLMGPRVKVAGPLLSLGYALVGREPVESIEALRGRRLAVVFNTPAQNALATLEDVETVTVREPEQALEKLLAGEVDYAFVWNAVAGWYDLRRADGSLYLIRVDGPRLRWESAAGVARGNEALRDRLQRILDTLRPTIDEIARRYGLVYDGEITWRWAELSDEAGEGDEDGTADRAEAGGGKRPAAGDESVVGGAAGAMRAQAAAFDASADPAVIARGRKLFNAILGCAHCHGPGAQAPDRPRDLRLMRERYGDSWREVYWQTVLEGRTETESGLVMPAWKDAASRQELESILAWLETMQRSHGR